MSDAARSYGRRPLVVKGYAVLGLLVLGWLLGIYTGWSIFG